MNRPLLVVALVYVVGLLLAAAIQAPLWFLFACAFGLLGLTLGCASARGVLLWPLILVTAWTNLASRLAVVSLNDLRMVAGSEPVLATVRGTLAETPSLREYTHGERESFRTLARLQVTALMLGDRWQPAEGPLVVATQGQLPAVYFAGREVEVAGVLSPPPRPLAPGLFDYRNHLARQGIYFQLKADGTNDWRSVTTAPQDPPFTDRFLAWAQRNLARGLPQVDESVELIWAMALGWKTGLTGEVNEPFMKSGTMHIFAISGLHIALLAGILVNLLRLVRLPRLGCGLVVIPLIWFYTAATGWQSSAIRSTVMMTIVIGGWSLRRPSDLLNSLAAAGLVILVWEPQQLFQASFQLSFFVVLSIALFLPPLERLRDRWLAVDPFLAPEVMTRGQRIWLAGGRFITTSLATSLAAWLGSLPLTAYYFHLFSPVTLLANLIIVPLSSFALMCNLGGLICGDWLPWVTELFNHGGWFWMLAMVKLSRWATALPGAYFYVASPSVFTFVVYYGLLFGTMSGWLWRAGRRGRTVAVLMLVLAFYGGRAFLARHDLELTVLPLNGGHAEFLDAAGATNDWLMDCGSSNAVMSVTRPFLSAKGMNHLAHFILTAGDVKNIGGAEIVAAEFKCPEHFASAFRFRSGVQRRLIANLATASAPARALQRGDQIGPWQILHPAKADDSSLGEDGVLVRRAEFHGVKVLLLSELGRAGQNLLLERTADLRADIVVAALPTRSEPLCDGLLDAIQPRLVIIADSERPATARASEPLKQRLNQRNGTVIYTRTSGAVTISFRPAGCEITTADQQHFTLETQPRFTCLDPNPEP